MSISLILVSNPCFSQVYASTQVTVVQRHDVVQLSYLLWIEDEINVTEVSGIVYVDDPGTPVPEKIVKEFPDIYLPPNVGFRQALEGMKAGDNKSVTVPPHLGFTDPSDDLYNLELYYVIVLHNILLDSSIPPFTLFDIPFFDLLLYLIFTIIAIAIIYKTYTVVYGLLNKPATCISCGKLAEIQCSKLGCLKYYCSQCYNKTGHCKECGSNRYKRI